MKIVVLPGDGIGPETRAVTVDVLQAASVKFDLKLALLHDIAGHDSLQKHGATVTPALLDKVKNADGLMLGPMATYDFKDEAKGDDARSLLLGPDAPAPTFCSDCSCSAGFSPFATIPSSHFFSSVGECAFFSSRCDTLACASLLYRRGFTLESIQLFSRR